MEYKTNVILSGKLQVLDQRKLPDVEDWLDANTPEDMAVYIKQLSVRGAPLIGMCAIKHWRNIQWFITNRRDLALQSNVLLLIFVYRSSSSHEPCTIRSSR